MKTTLLKMIAVSVTLLPFTSCSEEDSLPNSVKTTFTHQWKHDFTEENSQWEKAGIFTFDVCNAVFIPEGVELNDGVCELTISERTEEDRERARLAGYSGEERPYNSAEYTVNSTLTGEKYGRFSSYMKVTAPPGVVASFFLAYYDWSDGYTELLESSEIDIEFCGSTKEVQFALHYKNLNEKLRSTAKTVSLEGKDAGEGYHLWEIEWLPARISFYMDGEELHSFTDETFLSELREFPMRPDINYWVTKQNVWNVGTFDPSQLPITTHYDYISYASWDQM